MIPRRYAWLLRDPETMCDADLGHGHACRVCRATGRGETRLPATAVHAHWVGHRAEKLTDNEEEL